MIALHDQGTIDSLKNCGLLKFFCLSSMQKQMKLLQYLVHAQDPTDQAFHIRGKAIHFTIEDVYFLTGLSRQGTSLSLSGLTKGGESIRDYIRQFFREGSQPSRDGKIHIRDVIDRPLRTILFTLASLVGSAALHSANRSYMQYFLECLEPNVFNQCEAILPLMKD